MQCTGDTKFFDENGTDSLAVYIIEGLFEFQRFYRFFHRYISVFLCTFGLLANFVHIWVLTRPRMKHSSVHTVLACIAVADIGTMTSYMIYLGRYEFMKSSDGWYSYDWIMFLKIHVVLSIALHAVSIYLVVLMAFIRFRAMSTSNSRWMKRQCVA
ncbi:hypothetical protein AB6A40_004267 [Gnathostoma spinigerum]|uniref:G-protein coupled receptors family 1 profile domain-containing protein n=1 Tax=Gnathostoma spinigerum TaxID=75299 RepID=A0ABD6EC00_9BILA